MTTVDALTPSTADSPVLVDEARRVLTAADGLGSQLSEFLRTLHKAFYDRLPESMHIVRSPDGRLEERVARGDSRSFEVLVGMHHPPAHDAVGRLIERLGAEYDPVRFMDTISHRNFPGPQNPQDFGLLVVDRTDEVKLRTMSRRMRRYNPIPNKRGEGYRQVPLTTIVEDAVHRDSKHSYFIQLADVNAYFLLQKTAPCGYVQKKGARNYFDRLEPVLCKVANTRDPQGVVRL